jgi:hypothetical protein
VAFSFSHAKVIQGNAVFLLSAWSTDRRKRKGEQFMLHPVCLTSHINRFISICATLRSFMLHNDVLKENTQQELHKQRGMWRISDKTESLLSTPWWKGSKGTAPLILNLRTTCKWSDAWPGHFTPSTHRTWRWLGRRPRSVHSGQQKNLLTLPRIELWFLSCPAYNQVTILITISWTQTMKLKQSVFSYNIFQLFQA